MTTPELVTTTEAARRLGVTSQTIRRWIASGDLRAMRTRTGRYQVAAEDVERLMPKPVRR